MAKVKNKRVDSFGRVLKKGEGQRKDNTYYYRWTDKFGDRQYIYDQTLDGLREQEDSITIEISKGIVRRNITLNEQIEIYLSTKSTLALSTRENYLYYWNKDIKDEIGKKKIIDIVKSDLLRFYQEKAEKCGYSHGTIHILNKIIRPALQLAVDDNLLMKNPTDGTMKEYPEDGVKKYALDIAEEKELLERVSLMKKSKIYRPMIAIILYSGMRVSETLGLTWNDVDMERRTIDINHQLQYRQIKGAMCAYCIDCGNPSKSLKTKTPSGTRVIPMSDRLYSAFVEWRKEWFKMKKDSGYTVDGYHNFVFLSHMTGRPIYHNSLRRMLKRAVEMNDTREIKLRDLSPHILRHTACTRYIESGMALDVVQYMMGHANIKTTLEIYNHVNQNRVKGELKKFDEYQETCGLTAIN